MPFLARTRLFALSCALAFATSAVATTLIPLNSEQKAASGIVAGMRIQQSASGELQFLTIPARAYVDIVLDALAAATTPDALTRVRGGMTFPCYRSGSFNVRNSRAAPQVLEIEFAECSSRFEPRPVTGPLRLALLSNTFDAEEFASIRVGSRERDLVVTSIDLLPDQNTWVTRRYNYTMEGHIVVFRNWHPDRLTEESLFEINGFSFQDYRAEIPGRDPTISTRKVVADHVFASASIGSDAAGVVMDERTTFFWGSLQLDDTSAFGSGFDRFEFLGLDVHRVTDFAAWTDSVEFDGGVRYIWSQLAGRGCLSGGYLFDTIAPLHRPNIDFEPYDSGELVINRDVNVRLYSAAKVPAGLPVPVNGMLIHVGVNGVGSFDYDTPRFDAALWSLAQCPY
jgi:hypothetical protein